jgi:hypothetical protein
MRSGTSIPDQRRQPEVQHRPVHHLADSLNSIQKAQNPVSPPCFCDDRFQGRSRHHGVHRDLNYEALTAQLCGAAPTFKGGHRLMMDGE